MQLFATKICNTSSTCILGFFIHSLWPQVKGMNYSWIVILSLHYLMLLCLNLLLLDSFGRSMIVGK